MQLLLLFVQSAAWGLRFGYGPAHGLEAFTNHVGAQQVPFLGRKSFRVLFLQVSRLCQNEEFIHQRTVDSGEHAHIHAQTH